MYGYSGALVKGRISCTWLFAWPQHIFFFENDVKKYVTGHKFHDFLSPLEKKSNTMTFQRPFTFLQGFQTMWEPY